MVSSYKSNSKLVYSTDQGRIKEEKTSAEVIGNGDVRVRLEKKGRAGKLVTVISGLPLPAHKLKIESKQLKKYCGGGGSIKNGDIELQGDHVDLIIDTLKQKGYDPKRSGG